MPPPSPIAEDRSQGASFSFMLHSASPSQPQSSGRAGWSSSSRQAGASSVASAAVTTSSAFFTSASPFPSPASSPASASAFSKGHSATERKSNSPQRRLDLQQLLAAAQPQQQQPAQPAEHSPSRNTLDVSFSAPAAASSLNASFALPSTDALNASVSSSIFSTSTATFLQRYHPNPSPNASPAASPAPSPTPSPAASPLSDAVLGGGQCSTPPRAAATPSTIKKGLAASFANIISSPAQYNPAKQQPAGSTASTSASAASSRSSSSASSFTGGLGASLAACTLPAASPFATFPVPLSAAFTTVRSSSTTSVFSPSASFARPSYASTGDRSPTSHLSPLSSSSSSSASSSYGSDSGSTTPVSTRLHPLSRSTPLFSSPPAMGASPLANLLFAASELTTTASADSAATCTALLRLVLEHAQCDDAKLVTKAANGRWNVDVHVQTALPAAAPPVFSTPPSLLDPHGLLYDNHSSVPDLPVSVLQLASATQSLLQLTAADVLSDPALAADPFFSTRQPHHRPPLSLLALPVLVCRRECGVLLLAWRRHVQPGKCVSVPSVQLLATQVCLLLERRREERRRAEWALIEEECRQREEECKRVRRELHDTKAQLAAKA